MVDKKIHEVFELLFGNPLPYNQDYVDAARRLLREFMVTEMEDLPENDTPYDEGLDKINQA